MSKYYVAGIPFDGENCLKHYGVKGMKWDQHIFGPDANTKYINWLKDAGQNIGKFANKAASTVSSAAGTAAKAVGGALNKSANFVTGNQARQNVNAANANVGNTQAGRSKVNNAYARYDQLRNSEAQNRRESERRQQDIDSRAVYRPYANNTDGYDFLDTLDRAAIDSQTRLANQNANRAEIAKMKADRMAERQRNAETQARAEAQNAQQAYDRTLPGAAQKAASGAKGFLNSAGKWVSTAANNAGQTVSNAANSAAKGVRDFFSNRDEEERMNELAKNYDPKTGEWRSEADRQAFYKAQNAYNGHPLTAIPDMAKQIRTDISNGPVGEFARDVGDMASQAYRDAKNYIDYNVTGAGQNRDADMYEDWIRENREDRGAGRPAYQVDTEANWSRAANEARDDARNNTLFGRIGNAANAVGNWVGNAAQDVGNAANSAWNGVSGAASQAGQWLGDRAQDVGNAVGTAATNAWNGVSDAASKAGDWIGDRAQDVADLYTGGNHGENAERLDRTVRAYENEGDRLINQGRDRINEAADMTTPGMISYKNSNMGNPDSSAYASAAEDKRNRLFNEGVDDNYRGWQMHEIARSLGNRADAEQAQYDAAPRQRLTAAANAVGDAAGAARDWIGGAASDVRDWVGDRASDIGDAVTSRARQQASNDLSRNVDNAYERIAEKYGEDLGKHPVLWDSRARNELENELERAYSEYSKRIEDIEKRPVGNAISSLFHSELDNRPDGVSDAFWKQYVADGGTREQYERDWR